MNAMTSNITIIIVIYNADGKIRSAHRYMESVLIEDAVCRTLERFSHNDLSGEDCVMHCFEFPADSFFIQVFPEPYAELPVLLDKLKPCRKIPLIQAYWLYMNGYSPLTENLSESMQESILLLGKYFHMQKSGSSILDTSKKVPYPNFNIAIADIIVAAAGNIRLCDDAIKQLGGIRDKFCLESCLTIIWRYLDMIHPEDAMKLLQLWSENQTFRELLLTDEFCAYFKSSYSSLEAILLIDKEKRNAAHRTILALSLLSIRNEQAILQKIVMDMERTCQSVPTLFENDKLPISNYGAGAEQLAMEKKEVIDQIADAVSNKGTTGCNEENYIAKTKKLFDGPDKYRLDKTIRMFSNWSLLPNKKRMFNDVLSLFYRSRCWEAEPEYGYIVQCVLLTKLSSGKSLPFPPDIQRIIHLKDSDVPNWRLPMYLDVLLAYTAHVHKDNRNEIMGVLRKAKDRVLFLSEKAKHPLSYLSVFSDVRSSGIVRFLAETDEEKKGRFISAMKEYGLERLYNSIQYRCKGGNDLNKLVESRSAETLLFGTIRSLSQIIPYACYKGLVFRGWYEGVVKLNHENCIKLAELRRELSSYHKTEMLHAVFINDKHKLLTDVDIYMDAAISQYDGANLTEAEQEQLQKNIADMENTEYAASPGIAFFLRERGLLSDWGRLCQLKKQVHCINNFLEKNTVQAEIFLLVNSMKKKVGFTI